MSAGLSALTVLVVDDNRQMRTIIGAILTGAGVGRVVYAHDGVDALAVLHRSDIDVMFVDFEMPRMNGLELVSAIRSLTTVHRFVPIVMLTGYSDLVRIRSAVTRGINEFLGKPVTARDILARLEAVILNPRPFIQGSYFGPDRRRKRAQRYTGPMRRQADAPDTP